MKKLLFGIICFIVLGYTSNSAAYNACVPKINPFVPCTFDGVDYDFFIKSTYSAGVTYGRSNSCYFYRGNNHYPIETNPDLIGLSVGIICTESPGRLTFGSESGNPSYCLYPCGGGVGYFQNWYSYYLPPPPPENYTLAMTINPSESGGVSDYPAGENIFCGIDSYEICQASFPSSAEVTLDASPSEGYAFSHWVINGLAMADVDGSIDVTMSEDKNVVAVFYLKADDFVFPVLAQGVTDPLLNKFNPDGSGWDGPGVGEYSAAAGHLGQDYVMNYNNGDGNAAGEPVYAVANGTIVEVMNNQNTSYGWCDNDDHGWGPVVVIRHENRDGFNTSGSIVTGSCDTETSPTVIYSLYGHLSKTSIQNLQIGQTVTKGQQLGVVGVYEVDQESWTTNHLHFELKDEVGYTEGVWYKTPANEGACPESTNYPCDSYLVKGVGTAYSKENGFAPHRYEPGAFINANKQ